jgi:drug/metabolite transporter (DMT)-like permease
VMRPQRLPAPDMLRPYLALGFAMVMVSSAAILISLARAQGVPALAIAALRMGAAAAVVGPLMLARCRGELGSLPASSILLAVGAGVLLALHFAFWISSLDSTTVMSSVVFVSTNPLFVAAASALFLRERVGRWTLVGIVVAIGGGVGVALSDFRQAGAESVRGDALALLGAVAASGYLLLGRLLRRRMSLLAYAGIAYTAAAVVLFAIVLATRTPLTGYPARGYLWVALLALGPQLMGHTAYNWALKYVSATVVTVALLSEPVGATLLAIPILSQVPSPASIAGGTLILAGIFVAAWAEARAARVPPVDPRRNSRAGM